MSSSPKYTVVVRDTARIAAERRAHQAAVAARRTVREKRAEEARQHAAQRAQQELHSQRTTIATRLREVRAIAGAAAHGASGLLAEIAALEATAAGTTDIAGGIRAAEALRARALTLRAQGRADAGASRQLIAGLRERVAAAGPDAARLEPRRHARCTELIARLEQAEGVQFEALLGTVEHEVASFVSQGTGAAVAARAAVEQAEARLAPVQAVAESALDDARFLKDHELAGQLGAALRAAASAMATALADITQANAALAGVMRLEQLLPAADARLDELFAAHERRAELATALTAALAGQHLSFIDSQDGGDRFILSFKRPGGGQYTAEVGDSADSEDLLVSYKVAGEADIAVPPDPAGATCDQTEAALDALHFGLADSGYAAGELWWEGKPRSRDGAAQRRAASRGATAARAIPRELR